MAYIDKTFIHSWNEYVEIRDWCKSQPMQTNKDGETWFPSDFLPTYIDENDIEHEWDKNHVENSLQEIRNHIYAKYDNELSRKRISEENEHEYTDDEWKEYLESLVTIQLWNTPSYFDVYLIKNCHIDFIVKRLKEQYGINYQEIVNGTSIYDKYERNGIISSSLSLHKPKMHYTIIHLGNDRVSKHSNTWQIEVMNNEWLYNSTTDCWNSILELCNHTSCTALFYGSLKSLIRKIKKWDFPHGTEISICGWGNNYSDYKLILK